MIHATAIVSPHARNYTKRLSIGKHSRIDDGVILTGDIRIGDYVHIGANTLLSGQFGIIVGDYTGIAMFCAVLSGSDDFSGRSMANPTIPDKYRPFLDKGHIQIGKNSLIGSHCTLLPGIVVGDNVGIGSHSFVKSSCTSGWLYAGVPAERVRQRSDEIWKLTEAFEREVV